MSVCAMSNGRASAVHVVQNCGATACSAHPLRRPKGARLPVGTRRQRRRGLASIVTAAQLRAVKAIVNSASALNPVAVACRGRAARR